LYEFTVTDEHNLAKSEIIQIAEDTAHEEAPARAWSSYKVSECKTPEQISSGEIRYYFEVTGAYALGKTDEEQNSKNPINRRVDGVAAGAPELS